MKSHWENVFETKDTTQVSWHQAKPELGISLIKKYSSKKNTRIIDIGGGDSKIPDFLAANNYTDISVLDISAKALDVSKNRLKENANKVNWIESDITHFLPKKEYELWYDRAVFHFLTTTGHQIAYKKVLKSALAKDGIVILGSFSKNGNATRCSGINISQQDLNSYQKIFEDEFEIVDFFEDTHITPSEAEQLFAWVILRKK